MWRRGNLQEIGPNGEIEQTANSTSTVWSCCPPPQPEWRSGWGVPYRPTPRRRPRNVRPPLASGHQIRPAGGAPGAPEDGRVLLRLLLA